MHSSSSAVSLSAPAFPSSHCSSCVAHHRLSRPFLVGRPSKFQSLTAHRCSACHPPLNENTCRTGPNSNSPAIPLNEILDYLLNGLNSFSSRSSPSDSSPSHSLSFSERLAAVEFRRDSEIHQTAGNQRLLILDSVKLLIAHAKNLESANHELSREVRNLRELTKESDSFVTESADRISEMRTVLSRAKEKKSRVKQYFTNKIQALESQLADAEEKLAAATNENSLELDSQAETEKEKNPQAAQHRHRNRSGSRHSSRIRARSHSRPPCELPERLYLARLESDRAERDHQEFEDCRRSRVARVKSQLQSEKAARENEKQRIRVERRAIINKIKQFESERVQEENRQRNRNRIRGANCINSWTDEQFEQRQQTEENRFRSDDSAGDSECDIEFDGAAAVGGRGHSASADSPVSRLVSQSKLIRSRVSPVTATQAAGEKFQLEINGTATIKQNGKQINSKTNKPTDKNEQAEADGEQNEEDSKYHNDKENNYKLKNSNNNNKNNNHNQQISSIPNVRPSSASTSSVSASSFPPTSAASIAPVGTFTMYRIAKAKKRQDQRNKQNQAGNENRETKAEQEPEEESELRQSD